MKTDPFKRLALIAVALLPFAASAQLVQETSGQVAQDLELIVPLYKSRVLSSTVADRPRLGRQPRCRRHPGAARSRALRARQRSRHDQRVAVERRRPAVGSVAVEVTHDLDGLKRKLFELFPAEQIDAYAAQRAIVLSGSVSSVAVMDAALQLARGYLAQIGTAVQEQQFEQQQAGTEDRTGGQVINLHAGGRRSAGHARGQSRRDRSLGAAPLRDGVQRHRRRRQPLEHRRSEWRRHIPRRRVPAEQICASRSSPSRRRSVPSSTSSCRTRCRSPTPASSRAC